MLNFLHSKLTVECGSTFLETIAAVLKEDARNDIAVAYWGRGAMEKLGLDTGKSTRIVCDLLSGGCNPYEIKRLLLSFGADHVRHLGGLHAKVFLTGAKAIVGSANASANGLGDEKEKGTFEAALITDDESVIRETAAWFDVIWEDHSHPITENDLRKAEEAWRARKPVPAAGETVLQKYLSEPEWFRRRVWVTHYVTEASDESLEKYELLKHEYYSPAELRKWDGEYPCYDENIKDMSPDMLGNFVIDAADNALYTILAIEGYSKSSCLVLLKPEKRLMGLLFSTKERVLIKKAIKSYLHGEKRDVAWNFEDLPIEISQYLKDGYERT